MYNTIIKILQKTHYDGMATENLTEIATRICRAVTRAQKKKTRRRK